MHNFPQPRNQSDRRAGAILIAVGIGVGIALGQLMFDNVGDVVLIGVALGVSMFYAGMRKRQSR